MRVATITCPTLAMVAPIRSCGAGLPVASVSTRAESGPANGALAIKLAARYATNPTANTNSHSASRKIHATIAQWPAECASTKPPANLYAHQIPPTVIAAVRSVGAITHGHSCEWLVTN